MPVEIRELIIRARVGSPEQETSCSNGSKTTSPTSGQTELVQECVRQVLEILKKRKER